MATPSTIEEIQTYKTQLNEFLNKKFIDQSLLLGFNNVLQSKFQTLILSDCNDYYDNLKAYESQTEKDFPNNQLDLEFKTIKIFEILWTEFHYPIIKFFQFHHATYYNDFSKRFLDSNGKDKSLKVVEIRKINDNFNKFIKQVYHFYFTLLKHFSTHFLNPLIPEKFLAHFNFVIPNNAIKTFSANLQANLIFLIHRCLLSLGDISRHRSFMELSYVNPCLSSKNFWKYYHLSNLSNKDKISLMKPLYEKALSFYKFCILLLPALNEPYNHIGMIYNLMDSKYDACYWFLRSQFTRLPDYKLGLTNLNTILRKDWFINNLISFNNPNKKNKNFLSKLDELNITLICLICYYYVPENYQQSNNTIIRNIKYSKIEGDFFKNLADSFGKFIRKYEEDLNFYVKQLVVIMSFNKLLELRNDKSASEQFIKFTFRYINKLLDSCISVEFDYQSKRVVLIILRLLVNWFKENKVVLRNLQARKSVMVSIITLLNRMTSDIYSDDSLSQDINREKICDLIRSNSRPVRDYYFREDVYFRDFLIIKFQFKDFKDDHIFASNNINLLVGDYTSLIDTNTFVPSFLDNDLYKQLIEENKSDQNKGLSHIEKSEVLDIEIIHYENNLRLKSVILLSKKLLERNPYRIEFDYDEGKFVVSNNTSENTEVKVEVEDSQNIDRKVSDQVSKPNDKSQTKQNEGKVKSVRSGKGKHEHKSVPKSASKKEKTSVQVENSFENTITKKQEGIQIPNTLQELNSFILSHSSQLQDSLLQNPSDKSIAVNSSTDDILTQDPQRENGLKNMVDSLVLESSNSEPKSVNSNTPNIWKNGSGNEVISSGTPSQSFNMLNSTFSNTSATNDHLMHGGIPMPSQIPQGTHISPNYSQVFQQPYPEYFNPFQAQYQQGNSAPYYHGINDRFMPVSSQLLLHSIPPSLLQQSLQGSTQSPMQVACASPAPAPVYPQYGQFYNQFMGPPQHMQPPPPPQQQQQLQQHLSGQNSNQYGSTPYPS